MSDTEFRHFKVFRTEDGQLRHEIQTTNLESQPPGEVVIRVAWSSLNYKDALAAQAHPGVAGELPHVPGIDASGTVESSEDARYQPGDKVLVTGYELGAPRWGGWSELIRVPADWVVPLPESLSLREAMIYGTAGFTAAQCLMAIDRAGVAQENGPIVVTGATGGVGCFAVKLLSHCAYEVHAVTGKADAVDSLKALGAAKVMGRDELEDNPKRPLLSARFAGGIDTVGGNMLVALLKSIKIGGCVSACGLVGGDKLPMTVYPFILRGVSLAGVTSSSCPRPIRETVWKRLSSDLKVELPDEWVEETTLEKVPDAIERIKQGGIKGRVLVRVS